MKRPRLLCVGEAMIEMAPLGDGHYQRGFAGDTFNTAWHMAQVLGDAAEVGFVSRIGEDAISRAFADEVARDGLMTRTLSRSPDRTMGLYMIALDGVERSFHYWRSQSAARHLADDRDVLDQSFAGAGLIHLSGITVAILAPSSRATLLAALAAAREAGCRISFDPNIRPALWTGLDEVREVLPAFLASSDILLPSFDDEAHVWGDASPRATLERLAGLVHAEAEIVVKDGDGPVHLSAAGQRDVVPTPAAADIRDTTGAGDAFNAGYLCARMSGRDAAEAVGAGQSVAAVVLSCHGARADKSALRSLPSFLLQG